MVINMIAIIILLFISVGIIYIVMKSITINISNKITTSFVSRLSVFDDLIEEKRNILKELNEKIETTNLEQVKEKVVFRDNYIIQETTALYKDEDFRNNYIKVKQKFQNKEKNLELINNFVKENYEEYNIVYGTLFKIEKILNSETIEKLLKLDINEQVILLKKKFDEQQNLVLKNYIEDNEFEILDFIEYIYVEKEKYDNKIYVYGTIDYSIVESDIVKYILDTSIIEGFKIKFKNKIYDYSFS